MLSRGLYGAPRWVLCLATGVVFGVLFALMLFVLDPHPRIGGVVRYRVPVPGSRSTRTSLPS